jgi:hypothetical protein
MTGYILGCKEVVVKQAVCWERDAITIVIPTPRAAVRAAAGWWWQGWSRSVASPGDPTR